MFIASLQFGNIRTNKYQIEIETVLSKIFKMMMIIIIII